MFLCDRQLAATGISIKRDEVGAVVVAEVVVAGSKWGEHKRNNLSNSLLLQLQKTDISL